MARLKVACAALVISAHAAAADSGAPRVYSASWATWIHPRPSKTGQQLGYLRPGASLGLVRPDAVRGPGCAGGYVAVEPFGYVCLDRHATLDPSDRTVRALGPQLPSAALLPYRYALSNGTPMYRRLPTPEEWTKAERGYGPAGSFRPQYWGNRGHERLAEARVVEPDAAVPALLPDGGALVRRQIPHGSMLSFTRAFRHADRTWLHSADGTFVPADRVRPYRVSTFHGRLLTDGELPLLWVRKQPQPKLVLEPDGTLSESAGHWPVRSAIAVDGGAPVRRIGKRELFTTRERDRRGRPLLVPLGEHALIPAETRVPAALGARDKWLKVSITQGTLVAYEGARAVFTTLVSPGAGGVPIKGRNPVKDSTTPIGSFRITFKHLTDDMSPEQGDQRSFWLADVPYTQYFNMPFAFHAAYWHEDFGEPMSAGCVNLSPLDARWLFEWTEPRLPAGWHGVIATPQTGRGTLVVIGR